MFDGTDVALIQLLAGSGGSVFQDGHPLTKVGVSENIFVVEMLEPTTCALCANFP